MCMFFKELSQMMTEGTNISLTVRSRDGLLTVSLLPKAKGLKDEAKNHLQPIVLTGSAEELDAGFFDAVQQPVQKATGLLAGMKSFEESLNRVESEKKEAQEKKKDADRRLQERKTKYDKLIALADSQEAEGKNSEALQTLRDARATADGDNIAKTDARIDQLKAKCMQVELF